ncbi:MAG: hypothetical protein K2X02_04335 [Alphaproteobacteria bacterium]|nr:hypothetical protein [Alphaproteobacteria bacterium]
MVRKSYCIFIFTFALIKVDPVFSANNDESSCIEDSVEEGPYVGVLYVVPKQVIKISVIKEKNTGKPTALKMPPKKRGASCFFLRKRKGLNDRK